MGGPTSASRTRATRLYRPFQTSPRKPTRADLIQLLRRLYGPGIPTYPGSPYEGEKINDAELVLHELAHMTQFAFEAPVPVGDMEPTWKTMKDGLDEMSDEDADSHEVNAITIVLLVSRVLKLPLARDLLIDAGARNSLLLHNNTRKFAALVTEAEANPTVRALADQVLALIDMQWAAQTGGGGGNTAS